MSTNIDNHLLYYVSFAGGWGWVAGEIENRTKLSLCWVKAWLSLAITPILDENQSHN